MKLLLVIPALGETYGGPSKIAIELAQALGKLGLQVDLVTTNANGKDVLDVPLQTWILESTYRIQYFPFWGPGDYKFSNTLTRWLFREVSQYDIVHTIALFSWVNSAAHFACQWHKIPYVINPQGMLEPWALSYKAWKKSIYYRIFEKSGLMNASAIQMLSMAEARNIDSLKLKTPVVIVPNGLHRDDFEKIPDPEIFYNHFPHTRGKDLILFLARIDPKKGLDLLSAAFGDIRARFPEIHLVVAGPDNIGFLHTAKGYFSAQGCSSAVTFTGILTGTLKLSALSAAKIYVAPSYSEGFSMSVLEGMACGLPCVITTGCNFPEAASAKVAHVVGINVEEITTALIQCLQNPQQAKEMGNSARQFVLENYTWDKIAENLNSVYNGCIKEMSEKSCFSLRNKAFERMFQTKD